MQFAVDPHRGDHIEVHCEDFRQGRQWSFDGIATIDACTESPFKLQVDLTASNLYGSIRETAHLRYLVREAAVNDLINPQTYEHRIKISMAQQLNEWFEREDFGQLELDDFDEKESV